MWSSQPSWDASRKAGGERGPRVLVGAFSVALLIAAVFPTDAGMGFPREHPRASSTPPGRPSASTRCSGHTHASLCGLPLARVQGAGKDGEGFEVAWFRRSRKSATARDGEHEIGVLFDIDELGGGMYGMAAYRVFFGALDPSQLSGCRVFDGDVRATLDGSARTYCIAVQALQSSQVDYIRATMRQLASSSGLLPVERRFIEGNVVGREPLVPAGVVDEKGTLHISPDDMVQPFFAEGTSWRIAVQ